MSFGLQGSVRLRSDLVLFFNYIRSYKYKIVSDSKNWTTKIYHLLENLQWLPLLVD